MDRYRIDEVIGRGGMGAVYRARDSHLGRDVAVKVITVAAPDRLAHERLRSRFHREARAAAALHHPCVVAVHDFGTDPTLSLDFIVMELLRGEDLSDHLDRRGSPPPRTTLSIVEQAARGLAAGHRAGLIHRDVKPGNIFLEAGDRAGEVRVKILDFGIAELAGGDGETVTHLTVAGRSPCSPAFASPEQLRGEASLTPATDVFSLGAVTFQLLTGRRLFTTAEPRQMLVETSRSLADERARLNQLSDGVAELLRRALAPDAADRYQDAAQLADAIAGVGLPTRESDAHVAPYTGNPRPRRDHTEAERIHRPERQYADGATAWMPSASRDLDPAYGAGVPATRPSPVGPAESPAERRWIGRAASALASFVLTAVSLAAFAAAWFAAFVGVHEGDLGMVYAGAAASLVATPFALHRLMGRRGSGWLGIFASIAVTLACVYWLGDQSMELVLGTVFAAQILACAVVERVTSSNRGAESDEDFGDTRQIR